MLTYRIFKGDTGDELVYDDLVKGLSGTRVILFGERHHHAVIHGLQLKLTQSLYSIYGQKLVLGTEMFESDDQLILDEYIFRIIDHSHLVSEAKICSTYETDYRPLVEFAKAHDLRFVATNSPRRYANIVSKKGITILERLSREAKALIAPLPITVDLSVPGYSEMMAMEHGHKMHVCPKDFVSAQAIKDATMAHFIVRNLPSDGVFCHFNGDYHSRNYGGIYWYLKRIEAKGLHVTTIGSSENEDLSLEVNGRRSADYVIVVRPNG